MSATLNIWTIYQNTRDFPGLFVARRFELDQPTQDHFSDASLEKVRDWVQREAKRCQQAAPTRLDRNPDDEPVIVEIWV